MLVVSTKQYYSEGVKLIMPNRYIVLSEDFSLSPAGRFPEDGEFNATRFRHDYLLPWLNGGYKVTVNFDDCSVASSFLEEAFGGLVGRYTPEELEYKVHVMSTDPVYEVYARLARRYMRQGNQYRRGN